jgi:molybdenum cofactor biosynthesis enzyme MoaA
VELEKVKEPANFNYYEVEPEDSQFYTIGVDVTHRCNMECANCYSPIRDLPDVPLSDLLTFFKRLGKRTEVRLTGGEPTLRKDLPEMIFALKELGHRVAIMTNGLKLSDLEYCKTLKAAGLKFVCMSMNGANDDSVYEKMDGRKCADLKMKALENLVSLGFFININCILVRGVNSHVPQLLATILEKLNVNGVLRFRNIGMLGRYMKTQNYNFEEMVHLLAQVFKKDPKKIVQMNQVNGFEEDHNILFPIHDHKKFGTIWVKVTDWRPGSDAIPDPNSKRRGRMTKDLKVAPFFEHAKLNHY